MTSGLSKTQKIKFLKKRYNDAFDLLENTSKWLEKNSELNNQKIELLKSIRNQRLSGYWTQENAEKEQKLSAATRQYKQMSKSFMTIVTWCNNDEKAIKRLGGKLIKRRWMEDNFSDDRPSSIKRPHMSQASRVEIWKAKAELYDHGIRQDTSEVKLQLKAELEKYGKCAYCEERLRFEDCHLDHIHPVNKGGLTIPSNCLLVCARCNSQKSALPLRVFCKDAGLDFEKVVVRLEMVGKDV